MDEIVDIEGLFLPYLLLEMKEAFGLGLALRFASEFGGTTLSIPRKPSPGHAVTQRFGAPVLDWLIANHPGKDGQLEVPLGPFAGSRGRSWLVLRQALAEGKSVRQAARLAGVTLRTARRHRNGHSGAGAGEIDDDQLAMF